MEKWRDIPGYEKLYQASDDGQIRTCKGKTTNSARFARRVWKQRIIKQKIQKRTGRRRNGDARVSLWKDGKERTVLVSRLVAMTWCPGYREGLTVNHIDGNSLNNCAKNLEWVSIAENIRKGFDAGLFARNQKAVVLKRDSEKLSFVSMAEAGRYIGRSNKYISDCVKAGRKARALDGRNYDILSA